jgi:hypothetical protein
MAELAQVALLDQLVINSLLLGVHLCFKIKDENLLKPISWILFMSNLLWWFNSLLSFLSTNVTTNPQEAQNLFYASEVLDAFGKLFVVGFLYIKFWCISPKESMMKYAIAHIPFAVSVVYILIGFAVIIVYVSHY